MTFVTVTGAPEDVASLLNSLIISGNEITTIKLTKNNSCYLIGYNSTGPALNDFILLENGDFLLLESGDKIILQ